MLLGWRRARQCEHEKQSEVAAEEGTEPGIRWFELKDGRFRVVPVNIKTQASALLRWEMEEKLKNNTTKKTDDNHLHDRKGVFAALSRFWIYFTYRARRQIEKPICVGSLFFSGRPAIFWNCAACLGPAPWRVLQETPGSRLPTEAGGLPGDLHALWPLLPGGVWAPYWM